MSGSYSSSDDSNDSRKRPPEQELDPDTSPKRPNCEETTQVNVFSKDDNVHLKVLVPSIAAGAVIGKLGEAIGRIQKETNTKVKISKQDEFYPGTTERVCLIVGSLNGVMTVHNYIMDRIMEKPDPNPHTTGEGRLNVERHKQVKILVPNSTAGMVIGKGGSYIQEIKEKTGAYVQISQKSREINLSERCIVIAGELDQTRAAVHLILGVIAADPQSASCPNLSYHDVPGPVASVYPTGSPYATPIIPCLSNTVALSSPPVGAIDPATAVAAASMMAAAFNPGPSTPHVGTYPSSGSTTFGFFHSNYSTPQDLATFAALASSPTTGSFVFPPMLSPTLLSSPTGVGATNTGVGGDLLGQSSSSWSSPNLPSGFENTINDPNATVLAASVAQQAALLASFGSKQPDPQPIRAAMSPVFLPQPSMMPASLRLSPTTLFGYHSSAVGTSGCGLNTPSGQQLYGMNRSMQSLIESHMSPISGTSTTSSSCCSSPSINTNVAMVSLSGTGLTNVTTNTCNKPLPVLSSPGTVLGLLPGVSMPHLTISPLISPSVTGDQLTMSLTNLPSDSSLLLALNETNTNPQTNLVSPATSPQITPIRTTSSMLGLYALQYPSSSLPTSPIGGSVGNYMTYSRVISVPENVIGIILGPQGISIMDLQRSTGTLIQISQKGVYLPGTQNRSVTITGPQPNVQWAASAIEQIIRLEQIRRETNSSQHISPPIEAEYKPHHLSPSSIYYPITTMNSSNQSSLSGIYHTFHTNQSLTSITPSSSSSAATTAITPSLINIGSSLIGKSIEHDLTFPTSNSRGSFNLNESLITTSTANTISTTIPINNIISMIPTNLNTDISSITTTTINTTINTTAVNTRLTTLTNSTINQTTTTSSNPLSIQHKCEERTNNY